VNPCQQSLSPLFLPFQPARHFAEDLPLDLQFRRNASIQRQFFPWGPPCYGTSRPAAPFRQRSTCAVSCYVSSPLFSSRLSSAPSRGPYSLLPFHLPSSWPVSLRFCFSSRAFSMRTLWRRPSIYRLPSWQLFSWPSPPQFPFITQTRLLGMTTSGAPSRSPPRGARTPRKPAVFVPDCIPRCRARRG
jgi:hypothetical protein